VQPDNFIIKPEDVILVTGATGFIGSRVVENLLNRGFRTLRCLARTSVATGKLEEIKKRAGAGAHVEILYGNLLSREDCQRAASGAVLIYHLAAGRGEKSFPDAFLNSVVTTRNLLDAALNERCLRRFVNISSFSVYSNSNRYLDENCPLETHPECRGDSYSFAKVKQDELVQEYGDRFGLPYTIVRPGFVYGPGNETITGRVGLGTFGVFLHLGGGNPIPFSYVDNCAEAIVLAGLKPGVDREVFNVVDDDLPNSRQFLRLYKKNVKHFRSIYLPHSVSYFLCYLWERYSAWSQGQLPPVFNRKVWNVYWKKTGYNNDKLKTRLGWKPVVPSAEGFQRYFDSCKRKVGHA
jgi:nucleoside-diphosphate-sugar epimerase